MNSLTILVSIFGIIGTISSIYFAYIALKKNNKQESINVGKHEGAMFSDIGYIKACVDRVEKNLGKVDERNRDIAIKLAKTEEAVLNVTKRVDEIYKLEIP